MKIKCNKETIKKGFHKVESVISGSNINPILQNVRIIAKDNSLELSTTDLEVSVSYSVDSVDVIEPGKLVGPETKIASIIKEWSEELIELAEENRKCVIKGKDNYFKILCTDPEEFPNIPQFIDEDYIDIDKDSLSDMIKKTAFIILGDKTRYGTNGVFLDISGDTVKMVANDGRRLGEVKKKINNPNGISASCVIPVKGISQMLRIISEEDTVKLRVEEKRILLKTKNSTLCSQLLEVQYPKYEDVIPSNLDKRAEINSYEFTSAVRRGSVMTTEEYKLLKFRFSGDTLEIRCVTPDVGESRIVIPIKYSGEELEIGLNPEFLLDFLKNVDEEEVTLELRNSGTAGVFKVVGGCTYAVMPMSLEEKEEL